MGQRDLVAAWEQAFAAAGLPLAYSEGKRRTPQISLAAPLPQGVTSDWELGDMFFAERVAPDQAMKAATAHLPAGIAPVSVRELGAAGPSLQSQLRWAEYEVTVPAEGLARDGVAGRIEEMLAAESLMAEYRRETKVRQYDLRPLIISIDIESWDAQSFCLRMRLRAEPETTGRADQVLIALGLPPATRIHRRRLYLEESQPVVIAYRRSGEQDG